LVTQKKISKEDQWFSKEADWTSQDPKFLSPRLLLVQPADNFLTTIELSVDSNRLLRRDDRREGF
jgi:hypothetical protein